MTIDHEDLNLDALEATARAATPGPWDFEPTPHAWMIVDGNEALYEMDGFGRDAEHIATFDPPTVLALIARLREAEACIAEAKASEARTHRTLADREPTQKDSSQTWRILTAYKPTTENGGEQ